MRLRIQARPGAESGAVLLEVILGLVLFVAAAAVISSALSSSADATERLRLGLHADNLAASVLADLEMGRRSPAVPGPAPFEEPFTNWTWQVVSPQVDTPGSAVEIVVRHDSGTVVRRLAQVLRSRPGTAASTNAPAASPADATEAAP